MYDTPELSIALVFVIFCFLGAKHIRDTQQLYKERHERLLELLELLERTQNDIAILKIELEYEMNKSRGS